MDIYIYMCGHRESHMAVVDERPFIHIIKWGRHECLHRLFDKRPIIQLVIGWMADYILNEVQMHVISSGRDVYLRWISMQGIVEIAADFDAQFCKYFRKSFIFYFSIQIILFNGNDKKKEQCYVRKRQLRETANWWMIPVSNNHIWMKLMLEMDCFRSLKIKIHSRWVESRKNIKIFFFLCNTSFRNYYNN